MTLILALVCCAFLCSEGARHNLQSFEVLPPFAKMVNGITTDFMHQEVEKHCSPMCGPEALKPFQNLAKVRDTVRNLQLQALLEPCAPQLGQLADSLSAHLGQMAHLHRAAVRNSIEALRVHYMTFQKWKHKESGDTYKFLECRKLAEGLDMNVTLLLKNMKSDLIPKASEVLFAVNNAEVAKVQQLVKIETEEKQSKKAMEAAQDTDPSDIETMDRMQEEMRHLRHDIDMIGKNLNPASKIMNDCKNAAMSWEFQQIALDRLQFVMETNSDRFEFSVDVESGFEDAIFSWLSLGKFNYLVLQLLHPDVIPEIDEMISNEGQRTDKM